MPRTKSRRAMPPKFADMERQIQRLWHSVSKQCVSIASSIEQGRLDLRELRRKEPGARDSPPSCGPCRGWRRSSSGSRACGATRVTSGTSCDASDGRSSARRAKRASAAKRPSRSEGPALAGGKENPRRRAWIVSEDESGVSQRPVVRRTWAPRGHPPVLTHTAQLVAPVHRRSRVSPSVIPLSPRSYVRYPTDIASLDHIVCMLPRAVDRTSRSRVRQTSKRRVTLAASARKPVPIRNRILAGLTRKEYAQIRPDLTSVTLKAGQVLYEPGSVMQSAYFLETAIASILSVAANGTSIEVSVVGDDGVIGVPIVLRTHSLPYKIIVQKPGSAWRMKGTVLRREFDRCASLHQFVLYYLHTLLVALSQSSACNQFHSVKQRFCRWLLTSQDRAQSREIQSTQELLSETLGVNRGSASQAASALQKAGLISYRRGLITILDRAGVEAAACECYRMVKDEFERFFPA